MMPSKPAASPRRGVTRFERRQPSASGAGLGGLDSIADLVQIQPTRGRIALFESLVVLTIAAIRKP
jgi:hypothetical protein